MKVAFVTFGCRLNRAESLDLEARYRTTGHEIIDLESIPPDMEVVPDLILVRGCSVTAKAQRDCEKAIVHLRARFPSTEIRPIGCLTKALHAPMPQPAIPNSPFKTFNSHLSTFNSFSVPMQTSRAYLKIQDGCSGKCTFCIVPHFRGAPVSVPVGDITARTKSFLAAGYHEIVLTGCNLSLYKSDGHNLASLLHILAEHGTCSMRIRIGSLEPGKGCEKILDLMVEHPNICKFLHLSLQSGSDHILRRMKRPYNIESVDRFCTMARERLGPDLTLGADVITGFPGETDDDFTATRDFLIRHTFSNLHVFPYSERPGTPASMMDGAVPRATRLVRARNLTAIGRAQRSAFAQTFLGRDVEVCVERGGEHGWTDAYLPCKWKGPAERRSLVRKRIIAVSGDTLLA